MAEREERGREKSQQCFGLTRNITGAVGRSKTAEVFKNLKNDRQMGQLCVTCSNVSHSLTGKKETIYLCRLKRRITLGYFLGLFYIFQSINVFYENIAGRKKNLILVLYFMFHLCL